MFAVLFRVKWWFMQRTRPGMGSWELDIYPRCESAAGRSSGLVTVAHTWRRVGGSLEDLVEWRCVRCPAVAVSEPTSGEPAQGIDHHGD